MRYSDLKNVGVIFALAISIGLIALPSRSAQAATRSPVGFSIGDYAGDFVKEKETGIIWYIDVAVSRRYQVDTTQPGILEKLRMAATVQTWPSISSVPTATASSTVPADDLKKTNKKVSQPSIRGLVYDTNAPGVLWHIRRRANLRHGFRSDEEIAAYVKKAIEVKAADLYEYPIASASFSYEAKDPAKVPATSTEMTRPELKKFIRVSLKEQTVRAYENGRLVNAFLVSTGKSKFPTPRGEFSVLAKLPNVRYAWTYAKDSPDNYDLGSVPFNLRIMPHKYIHYAYWHNSFGRVMSHGCVNVNLKNIKWIYRWADEGVPVFIH